MISRANTRTFDRVLGAVVRLFLAAMGLEWLRVKDHPSRRVHLPQEPDILKSPCCCLCRLDCSLCRGDGSMFSLLVVLFVCTWIDPDAFLVYAHLFALFFFFFLPLYFLPPFPVSDPRWPCSRQCWKPLSSVCILCSASPSHPKPNCSAFSITRSLKSWTFFMRKRWHHLQRRGNRTPCLLRATYASDAVIGVCFFT